MRLRNFLDFESRRLSRGERLTLILQASDLARQRARNETEQRELEFVYRDCKAALSSLANATPSEEQWIDRRIGRMMRVLNFHESAVVRLNRRYWWLFFAIGILLLLLAIYHGSPPEGYNPEPDDQLVLFGWQLVTAMFSA